MSSLQGRVALVTGASRGIGRATAELLAREGAHVVLTSRDQADLDVVAESIHATGGAATPVAADVGDAGQMERAFAAAEALEGRFDILVNNAGIGILGALTAMSDSDFDDQVRINIRSVFVGCRRMVPGLERLGGGNIVNIASISGLVGMAGASVYSMTKWATVGLSRALDKELSPRGIKVTAICPAGVETTWAFGTGIDPSEVADADRLTPSTIAEAVLFALRQPANARVSEIVVYPMSENSYQ